MLLLKIIQAIYLKLHNFKYTDAYVQRDNYLQVKKYINKVRNIDLNA